MESGGRNEKDCPVLVPVQGIEMAGPKVFIGRFQSVIPEIAKDPSQGHMAAVLFVQRYAGPIEQERTEPGRQAQEQRNGGQKIR